MKQDSTAKPGGGDVQGCPRLLSSAHVKTIASRLGRKHARDGAYLINRPLPHDQAGPARPRFPFVHGQSSGELQQVGSNTEHHLGGGRSINHPLVGWTQLQQQSVPEGNKRDRYCPQLSGRESLTCPLSFPSCSSPATYSVTSPDITTCTYLASSFFAAISIPPRHDRLIHLAPGS